MDKLKAIVVGAYPRFVQKIEKRLSPFLDFRLIQTEGKDKLNNDFFTEARVIVILKDYVGRGGSSSAHSVGRARRIPVIECKSENHVQSELLRHKLIGDSKPCAKDGNGKATPQKIETVPVAATTPQPIPEPQNIVGIDQAELWRLYGGQIKEFVSIILEPEKRYHEVDLLAFMSKEVGIPASDLKPLLEELAGRGLITRVAENTWKRPGDEEPEEEQKADEPEAEIKQPYRREEIASKVRGLTGGPWPSRYALSMELLKYRDFFKKDGQRPSKSYCMAMMGWAIEAGYVEERDGKFHVLNDPSVKLEPDPGYVNRNSKRGPKPKKEPVAKSVTADIPTTYTSLSSLKTEIPPKSEKPESKPEAEKSVRELLGPIPPAPILSGQLRILKDLMISLHWDESAFRELSTRLVKLGHAGRIIPKGLFTPTEWDALAWADLSKLPLGVIVPTWRAEPYEDEKLTCIDCHETFIFSKGEKEYYFRTFGQISRPRRCKWCMKLFKERGGNDPDAGAERILSRHGG